MRLALGSIDWLATTLTSVGEGRESGAFNFLKNDELRNTTFSSYGKGVRRTSASMDDNSNG